MNVRHVALLAPLLAVSLAWAVGPPPAPPAEVTKLISQLAEDDLPTRRAAMTKLEALGEPVVLALRKVGREHADVDVRLRAHAVAGAIEAKLYGELRQFTGHSGEITGLAVSPDGKTLASGAWTGQGDTTVRLWDVATGKNTATLKGHTDGVPAVAFLPGGKRLLSGSGDRTLRVWDVAKGTELRQLPGMPMGVEHLAVSGDGKSAVGCGTASTGVYVWDLEQGKLRRTLAGHASSVRGVAFLGNDRCLSASFDGTVRVWDAKQGQQLASLPHGGQAWFVAVRPGGKQAASVGQDGRLRIWDLRTYRLVLTVEGHAPHGSHGVAYSPDGKRILTCGYFIDHSVRLWDAETGRLLQALEGHTNRPLNVAFLPGGKQAVSASSDKTLRLWNLRR